MRKRSALVVLMIGLTALGCSRGHEFKSQNTELARELITVAKLDRGIGNLLKRARTDTNSQLPQEFSISNLEKIEQAYVDAYASVYSTKELQAYIEFFKSPEGQQWVERQKQVNAKVASTIERLMPQTFESSRKYINGMGASSIFSNSLSSSNSLPNPAPSLSP